MATFGCGRVMGGGGLQGPDGRNDLLSKQSEMSRLSEVHHHHGGT